MTGPQTPPPPPTPGRSADQPLDPNSPQGLAATECLARTLAEIELEIAQRNDAADRERSVRAA